MGNDQKKEKAREKGRWFWGKGKTKERRKRGDSGASGTADTMSYK